MDEKKTKRNVKVCNEVKLNEKKGREGELGGKGV